MWANYSKLHGMYSDPPATECFFGLHQSQKSRFFKKSTGTVVWSVASFLYGAKTADSIGASKKSLGKCLHPLVYLALLYVRLFT